MIFRFVLFLTLASVGFGAQYAFPADRQPVAGSRTPNVLYGVGVVGGIPVMSGTVRNVDSFGADPTGVSDSTSAITATIAASTTGDVVAFSVGTYKTSTITIPTVGGGFRTGILLRGVAGSNGRPSTTISVQSGAGISWGADPTFGDTASSVISSGLTKGSAALVVATPSGFSASKICRITLPNDYTIPSFNVNTSNGVRFFDVQITSVAGSTLNITPKIPMDLSTLPAGSTIAQAHSVFPTQQVGVENLLIDCSPTAGGSFAGVYCQGNSAGSWLKNVEVQGQGNYAVLFSDSINCELRHCWLRAPYGGPTTSKSGFLLQTTSNFLVEDNIVEGNGPDFELNYGVQGCVFGYNYVIDDPLGKGYDTNHGPYNSWNLYEGSLACATQADGYTGGVSSDTFYRNWIMAFNNGGQNYCLSLKRFTRNYSFVGNLLGNQGATGGGSVWSDMGGPNLGNGDFSGTSSFAAAKGTLTTRTSASIGTITAASGHTTTTGATVNIWWVTGSQTYSRIGVTVGTVSGTAVPFSGGIGSDLPSSSATIFLPTTNTSIISYPIDWNGTTQLVRTWPGTLTTRTNNTDGVVTVSTGLGPSLALHASASGTPTAGLFWSGGGASILYLGTITGDVANITGANATLPIATTATTFTPSPGGFQEIDSDVYATLLKKANFNWSTISIPADESIGSETLADSLYLASKPSWFGSLAWPPFNPYAPPATFDNTALSVIPASYRYINGNQNYLTNNSGATVAGSTTVTGTVTFP